jgi:hypothetical protein
MAETKIEFIATTKSEQNKIEIIATTISEQNKN